jgi:hypothetical protein
MADPSSYLASRITLQFALLFPRDFHSRDTQYLEQCRDIIRTPYCRPSVSRCGGYNFSVPSKSAGVA